MPKHETRNRPNTITMLVNTLVMKFGLFMYMNIYDQRKKLIKNYTK